MPLAIAIVKSAMTRYAEKGAIKLRTNSGDDRNSSSVSSNTAANAVTECSLENTASKYQITDHIQIVLRPLISQRR
jgi:hypothetical protein